MKFTYLLIDFFTVIIPLLFSFHPRFKFYKTWPSLFPAVIITGIYFILWDAYFTHQGVWGFNPQYLTGIVIGNLPVEELLFFFCIPYACMFTFHCLNILPGTGINRKMEDAITVILVILLPVVSIINYQKLYTLSTFSSLAVLLFIARFVLHVNWLGKFYIVYAILLLPFFVVNGILTGSGLESPVVWYNGEEMLGIRIMTIPVEDIFYGMELVLLNLVIYLHMTNRYSYDAKSRFSRI